MRKNIALATGLLAVALFAAPRAKADGIFTGTLSGTGEVPPTVSTATGFITVTVAGSLLNVTESFTGLVGGPAEAAHIHCCAPAGVNAPVAVPFPGFPAATSGTYSNTFDLTLNSTYTSTFLTASGGTAADAQSVLLTALFAGDAYVNIHDAVYPGGEIRGQLMQRTPEPGTISLLLSGLFALVLLAGRIGLRREHLANEA